MQNNAKITVWKKVRPEEEKSDIWRVQTEEGDITSVQTTAEEFLQDIASQFLLDQDDINYIIKKTPDNHPERWKNLIASTALFIRCPKSKVPPMTVNMIIKKIKACGYYISKKTIWKGMKHLRGLNLYPSYCPTDEIKLLEAYEEFLKKEFRVALSDCVFKKTGEILKDSREKEIAIGRNPIARIFAAIYISAILCDDPDREFFFTQWELSKMSDISEATIRGVYKELIDGLGRHGP